MWSIGIASQQTTIDKLAKVQKWLLSTNDDATDHLHVEPQDPQFVTLASVFTSHPLVLAPSQLPNPEPELTS